VKLHHQFFLFFVALIFIAVISKDSSNSLVGLFFIAGIIYFPIAMIAGSIKWAKSKIGKNNDGGSVVMSENIQVGGSDGKNSAVSSEALTTFKSSSDENQRPAGYKIPSAPAGILPTSKNSIDQLDCGYWIAAGQDVVINKEKISGGMLYVGNKNNLNEPSIIDPLLPVSASGDYSADMSGYWPSYSECAPEQRRAYLNWLKGGRSDPNTGIGYVFIYFYGLERRALIGASYLEEQKDEVSLIIDELKRLLSIYHFNKSFKSYCSNLISFLEIKTNADKVYLRQPSSIEKSYQIPIDIMVAAGQAALDSVPLPARWAFAWAATDTEIAKPMPLRRCADKFALLFERKYQEHFGDGLIIPANKRLLKYDYTPASATIRMNNLSNLTCMNLSLPNVTEIQGNKNKLEKIVALCAEELEAYSRYVGKNPGSEGTIEASSLLPAALWPDSIVSKMANIKEMTTDGVYKATWDEIIGILYAGEGVEITKEISKKICLSLSLFGIGAEYNNAKNGVIPEGSDCVALYPIHPSDKSSDEGEGYVLAALTLQAASAVCAADDDFSAEEVSFLEKQISSWTHLNVTHRNKLRAQLQILISAPMQLKGIKSKLSGLPKTARDSIAGFLAAVVQADGVVRPDEVKQLEKIYQSLGLDKNKVFDDLHVALSGSDPLLTKSKVENEGFRLDPLKIAELKKDTDKISAILSGIFTDDTESVITVSVAKEPLPDNNTNAAHAIAGLSATLNAFVAVITSQSVWQRSELESAATKLQLMLDGALEQINDACFEQFDMALLEGDDPLEVNPDVLEMIS
jgi:uncharacterized tellurite resistance protein B-like protein